MSSRNLPNKQAAVQAAKQKFKAGPHATFSSPKAVPPPTQAEDDYESDESDDEPVEVKSKPMAIDVSQNQDDDEDDEDDMEFPSIVESSKKKASSSPSTRPPITFARIKTDAPFEVNGILFLKSPQFNTMTFAISPHDAAALNKDLVENFQMNADTPLVKFDPSIGAWLLRGKPAQAIALAFDTIQTKRGYTIVFNIGEWANAQAVTAGISAQIIALRDSKGNSVGQVTMKFPKGTTYSAGRRINDEEDEDAMGQ